MNLPTEHLPAWNAARQELVLLHGWGGDREVWRPLLARLRPWANVTLMDIPGCVPAGPAADESIDSVLQHILDNAPQRAVYVGFSLGGKLALELAGHAPDRVLAVAALACNPLFIAAEDWPGMSPETFCAFKSSFQRKPSVALVRFDSLQTAGTANERHLMRRLRSRRVPSVGGDLAAGLGWLESLDQRELVESLPVPQCHLFAQADALVPVAVAAAVADRIAGRPLTRVKVLENCSHLLPFECPDVLADEVSAFLNEADLLTADGGEPASVSKVEVASSFSRAAKDYDSVAHLQRDVGQQLLSDLPPRSEETRVILDMGCGTGYFAPELEKRYPDARYIGLDIAPGMVDYARSKHGITRDWLVGDAEDLPLAATSVDLVFSSLAIQWCYRPELIMAELQRILRPGGKCVFTSLGPDTLRELRSSWAAVDDHAHVNAFLPPEKLHRAAAAVPGVSLQLKVENVVLNYQRVRDLLDELKVLGAHNMNKGRPRGLTGRRALQGMLEAYEGWRQDGQLPATYEVVFGVLERA